MWFVSRKLVNLLQASFPIVSRRQGADLLVYNCSLFLDYHFKYQNYFSYFHFFRYNSGDKDRLIICVRGLGLSSL